MDTADNGKNQKVGDQNIEETFLLEKTQRRDVDFQTRTSIIDEISLPARKSCRKYVARHGWACNEKENAVID